MAEHIFFNGRKYYRNAKGYYCSSRPRPTKCLHIEVWKAAHGEIPEGYEIHHKDFNPSNNALENLQCLTRAEHRQLHLDARRTVKTICLQCGKEFLAVYKAKFCSRKCKRRWLEVNGRCNDREKRICVVCGKEFETSKYKHSQYCSSKCVVAATKHLKEKLTHEQKAYIRKVYKPRDPEFGGAALARKFNVGNMTISRVVSGQE